MSLPLGNRQPFRSGGPFLGRVPWRQLGSPWGVPGSSSGFSVLPSAGTPSYTVTLTVLDSAGTGFTVPQAVLSSAGTSYNPV